MSNEVVNHTMSGMSAPQSTLLRRLAVGIVVVAVAASMLTVAPPLQNATAAESFARSARVERGNFFNPDGVLYGYLADYATLAHADDPSIRAVQSSHAQISYHESRVGTNVSIVHVFSGKWENNFSSVFAQRLETLRPSIDDDSIPMYSLGTPDADHVRLLLENDAAEIQKVQAWATTYLESGIGPMFARLAHEADRLDSGKSERPWRGQPQLFIDWWRKFITVVETDTDGYTAPTDLIWQWSPTAWGFWHNWNKEDQGVAVDPLSSRAAELYPGDAWVDWIGSSGYDYPCAYRNQKMHKRSHEAVLAAAAEWASKAAPTKPFMVAEWGSENTLNEVEIEGTPGSRSGFFETTRSMLASPEPGFDQIAAIVYFDRHHNEQQNADGAPAGCNWQLHESSLRFPEPNRAFDEGRNTSVSVTDAADFAAYKAIVDTAGLFVPPGPGPAGEPGPVGRECAVTAIADAVEVTWRGFGERNVNLRRDGRWLFNNRGDAAITSYVDDGLASGATHAYVARSRIGGQVVDTACGTATMPACAVEVVDGTPTVSWANLNRTSYLRVNDTWRADITDGLAMGAYADIEAKAGTTNSYSIRIFRDGAATNFSCGTATVPAGAACSAQAQSGVVTITWNDVDAASSLNLLRNGKWLVEITDLAATQVTDATVAAGMTATYTLRVRGNQNVTDLECGEVTLASCVARAVAGGIEVAWVDQDGAGLNLRRDGRWHVGPERTSTSYLDDRATPGTLHHYELIARGAAKRTIDCGSATY